jgi:hypothetical protein
VPEAAFRADITAHGARKMADEAKVGTHWQDVELDAIVADYFAMLEFELSGQPYVKSIHSAALMAQMGRTHRSVEFKHQISRLRWLKRDARDIMPFLFFPMRYNRLPTGQIYFLRAMAEAVMGLQRTGDSEGGLKVKMTRLGHVRAKLIEKGVIYTPVDGEMGSRCHGLAS